jgi:hypothetical protein
VYFAYTFPFSYEDCEKNLEKLANEAKKMKSVYYCDEVLIRSPEGRRIHLLTVTSSEGETEDVESIENGYLFPEGKCNAKKFNGEKRVVIVSARVHPA